MKYRIEFWGRGGEIVVGNIEKETYQYFTDNSIDLDDYCTDTEYDENNGDDYIPEELRPFSPGEWLECDDVAHESGVSIQDILIKVLDASDNVIHEDLTREDLVALGAKINVYSSIELEKQEGKYFFKGYTIERGLFATFEVDVVNFDIKNISIECSSAPGMTVADSLEYEGSEVIDLDIKETRTQIEDYDFIKID